MKKEMIQKVAQKANLPEVVIKKILYNYGLGLEWMLRKGVKSRINIPNLGTFKCTPETVNRYIKYEMMTALRYHKRNNTEKYETLKKKIKRAWQLKQDGIKYLKRKNAKYYPNRKKE